MTMPERPLADLDWPQAPSWARWMTVACLIVALALPHLPSGLRDLIPGEQEALWDIGFIFLGLTLVSVPFGTLLAVWASPRQRRVMLVVVALAALVPALAIFSMINGGLPPWLENPLRIP